MDTDVFERFATRYGLDINYDINGNYTPYGRRDIGAMEYNEPTTPFNILPMIADITLEEKTDTITVDLDQYFGDESLAQLVFSVTGDVETTVEISGSIARISASRWTGSENITLIATNHFANTASQEVLITVTERDIVPTTPTIEDVITDLTFESNRDQPEIDLYAAFADTETPDEYLVFSITGNTAVLVSAIVDGKVTLDATAATTETLTITATNDFDNSISQVVEVVATGSQDFLVNPNFTTADLSDFAGSANLSVDTGSQLLTVTAPTGSNESIDFSWNAEIGTKYDVVITARALIGTTAEISGWTGVIETVSQPITNVLAEYTIQVSASTVNPMAKIFASTTGSAGDAIELSVLSVRATDMAYTLSAEIISNATFTSDSVDSDIRPGEYTTMSVDTGAALLTAVAVIGNQNSLEIAFLAIPATQYLVTLQLENTIGSSGSIKEWGGIAESDAYIYTPINNSKLTQYEFLVTATSNQIQAFIYVAGSGSVGDAIEFNLISVKQVGGGALPINLAPVGTMTLNSTFLDVVGSTNAVDPEGGNLQYHWDMDDGTTYSTREYTHTYATAGTYDVTLEVLDDVGQPLNLIQELVVVAAVPDLPPVGTMTLSSELLVVAGTNDVTDPEGGLLVYLWDMGDGTTYTTSSISHTYISDGAYTVTLSVTDINAGVLNLSESITVADVVLPSLGDEIMVNPDFITNDLSDWQTPNVSISVDTSAGEMTITSNDGNQDRAEYHLSGLNIGSEYLISHTVRNGTSTSGEIKSFVGFEESVSYSPLTAVDTVYEYTLTASATSIIGRIYCVGSGATGETAIVSRVSVQELL